MGAQTSTSNIHRSHAHDVEEDATHNPEGHVSVTLSYISDGRSYIVNADAKFTRNDPITEAGVNDGIENDLRRFMHHYLTGAISLATGIEVDIFHKHDDMGRRPRQKDIEQARNALAAIRKHVSNVAKVARADAKRIILSARAGEAEMPDETRLAGDAELALIKRIEVSLSIPDYEIALVSSLLASAILENGILVDSGAEIILKPSQYAIDYRPLVWDAQMESSNAAFARYLRMSLRDLEADDTLAMLERELLGIRVTRR